MQTIGLPTYLLMPFDLTTIELVVAIAVGVVTIVGAVFAWSGKAWRWASLRLRRNSPVGRIEVPSKSLILNPTTGRTASWWSLGKADGVPAMGVYAVVRATNISKYEIVPTVAKINKSGVTGLGVGLKSGNITQIGTDGRILVDGVCKVDIYFRIQPPFCDEGKAFKANIAIVDQFGNEHWLKDVVFEYGS